MRFNSILEHVHLLFESIDHHTMRCFLVPYKHFKTSSQINQIVVESSKTGRPSREGQGHDSGMLGGNGGSKLEKLQQVRAVSYLYITKQTTQQNDGPITSTANTPLADRVPAVVTTGAPMAA